MTLPDEQYNAIESTREFLRALLNPKLTPKVPKAVRINAYWCLKHYPSNRDFVIIKNSKVVKRTKNETR